MLIIGDVHGKIEDYLFLIRNQVESIQVGDLGVGFVPVPKLKTGNIFIRGNHDNPDLCRKHPSYMGEWGYKENKKLFYISGAYSIDKEYRTPGINWWADEELTMDQLRLVAKDYVKHKPEIVVSHCSPESVKVRVLHPSLFNIETRTETMMQEMLDSHKPKLWIFGHLHKSFNETINGTRFICLNELETYKID